MASEEPDIGPVNPWPGPAGIHARELPPSPGHRYQRYLERPPGALRFDAALEAAYVRHRVEHSLPLLRLSMALALAFYFTYLGLDYALWRRFDQPFVYLMLWGISAPSVLLLLLTTYPAAARATIPQVTRLVVIVNAAAMVATLVLGQLQGLHIPSQVLIIQLLYDFFLTGLLFRSALPIAAGTVVIYGIASQFAGLAPADLFDTLYFLAGTVVLGGMACYVDERTDRTAWLQSQLLGELAQRDGLTSLLNRRTFYDKAAATLAHARRDHKTVALLLVDADHFKQLNDTFGHLAGDECLCRIAGALTTIARRPLDVAGRVGGEEFALLLYDTNLHWAMHCAQALRHAIAKMALNMEGRALLLTVSVGLAVQGPEEKLSVAELMDRADRGLYQAKAAGRNRVCVNS